MTPEQQTALRAPFPPELIGTLPKGRGGIRYVSHAHVTDRLLDVDPEWTWEIVGRDGYGNPQTDEDGGLWIALTVCGVTRYGYGDPQNAGSSNAVKEAISDAIRNAGMRFGVGLDLWMDKSRPVANHRDPDPVATTGPATSPQIQKIQVAMKRAGFTDRESVLDQIGELLGRTVGSSKELTRSEASRVIDAMNKVTA